MPYNSFFIEIPSVEGLPDGKAKEIPSSDIIRPAPLETNPIFLGLY